MGIEQKRPGVVRRALRVAALGVCTFLVFQFISIDLSWQKQLALGILSIALGLAMNRISGSRMVTVAMMLISIAATFRYGWWRVMTLAEYFAGAGNQRPGWDGLTMLILIGAEVYTTLIMILGYMQMAWPLERRPIPMPADERKWPDVDVLIPTYNEPLALVRYTALAALNIDYPPDKLHVYLLDDGTRAEYRAFCAEAGVGYVTRTEHLHAKAGNINHALGTMHSPFVAIFDCDHVPTRSFLQMTMGWMLADEKLAMLQTPHHFYSPDPFERNLQQYKSIPNEGDLFYGIVQDGNDFWNATFFCGSCAVIRRSALDEVGGIAVETVTEDAHTSLRMQRRGYNTAYINIPLAAGLATETLAAHVGQRVRWARGMIQILRTDNPLLGKGLKFTQRLCYFNAMAHFLYALPRLVFLLAPLVYLLTGHSIIPGYWVTITVYALPHLYLSGLTNSRIQSWHRHSFWNEIYEAVLAPYILVPTLLALVNPRLGKFNVTAKGSTLAETRFDRRISAPTRWLLGMNFLGLAMAPYRLLVADRAHPGAVTMNVVWVLFNIVILGVAAAVAHEHRQRRESVRIEARIGVRLGLAGGRMVDGETLDMSVGGASVAVFSDMAIGLGDRAAVLFPHVSGNEWVRAEVLGVSGNILRLAFLAETITDQETLARALYSRADAWISNLHRKEVDRPLVSLGRVMVLAGVGLYQMLRSVLPAKREAVKKMAGATAALLILGCAMRSPAAAPAVAARPAVTNPAAAVSGAPQVRQTMTFQDLGVESAIKMRGPHSYYSVSFPLAYSLVPQQAVLKLVYTLDPALDPRTAWLRVEVNGVTVAMLKPVPDQAGLQIARIAIPPLVLVRSNTMTFEFTGNLPAESEQQARQRVYSRIALDSSLAVSGAPLRLEENLAKLPLPVFDGDLKSETKIPFVLYDMGNREVLKAAGIVASWLGVEAGTRPPRLSAVAGTIPAQGNAVVVGLRTQLPAELGIPTGAGPLLALRPNPNDAYGSLLIVTGGNDTELIAAASELALTGKVAASLGHGPALKGDTAELGPVALPKARALGDAPRWMQAGADDAIAGCQNPLALETDGSSPVRVYFHLPPDLFLGERQNVGLTLNYRYDARQVEAGSALRTVVNGNLVSETALAPGPDFLNGQRTIQVPAAALRPFGNTILFNFDFVARNRDPAKSSNLYGAIQCSSTLDLRGTKLWTQMPNLNLFSSAGFPFTERADLAQTDVVLPGSPKVGEAGLYLQLMSHFGAQTGYPALRVTVDEPTAALRPDRDYLVLGVEGNQPAFAALGGLLPVTVASGGRIEVRPENRLRSALAGAVRREQELSDRLFQIPHRELTAPTDGDVPDALVEEARSPVAADRSVVVVELKDESAAEGFATALMERSQSEDMTGPLSLLWGTRFASYQVDAREYQVGSIGWYEQMRIYLAQHFLLMVLAVAAMSLLMGRYVYEWLAWKAQKRVTKWLGD